MIATGAAMMLAANTACPSMVIFFIAQPPTLDAAVISQD
ncbi:putative lipoprotein [Mycobacteroides abscessus 3A-0930-S]|nr:putative lipoprotein [Mycobacteroides abscessus 3A-0122-S]EIV56152.1 putative lipoprotein [Mycobacteroides abscessus 3A-0930-S]